MTRQVGQPGARSRHPKRYPNRCRGVSRRAKHAIFPFRIELLRIIPAQRVGSHRIDSKAPFRLPRATMPWFQAFSSGFAPRDLAFCPPTRGAKRRNVLELRRSRKPDRGRRHSGEHIGNGRCPRSARRHARRGRFLGEPAEPLRRQSASPRGRDRRRHPWARQPSCCEIFIFQIGG